jgi:hypothetical protein
MSTLGKVLAVFNVLAAIAFLALAAMDYSKRQGWAHAHFRSEVAIHGLPLDMADDTGRLPGRPIADQLGKDARADLFRGQGEPVATQVDEVRGVVNAFENELQQAPDINAKRAVLTVRLLPLQTRGDQRDQLIRDLRGLRDQAGVEKLVEQFKGIANKAIDPAASGGKRDPAERRRAIADFLYNYDSSQPWHARVQTVVGLAEYAAAADRQYGNLRDMAQRLRAIIADEQTTFVREYQAELPKLQTLADRLKAVEGKLTERQELVQKHTALRNARQAEAEDLQKKLDAERQAVAEETTKLAAVQQQLFALQQDFAKAQATNQRLETELRGKETEK